MAGFGALFRGLGKIVFAVYDKQTDAGQQAQIVASVDHAYEAPTKGFENLLLNETAEGALRRFAAQLVADGEWPLHLATETPQPATPVYDLKNALRRYLVWSKGSAGAADLLGICTIAEMPTTVKAVLRGHQGYCRAVLALRCTTRRNGTIGERVPDLKLCDRRKALLGAGGHLLVLGGPGSGKTTVALVKAATEIANRTLAAEQKILFLSFARATVARIVRNRK